LHTWSLGLRRNYCYSGPQPLIKSHSPLTPNSALWWATSPWGHVGAIKAEDEMNWVMINHAVSHPGWLGLGHGRVKRHIIWWIREPELPKGFRIPARCGNRPLTTCVDPRLGISSSNVLRTLRARLRDGTRIAGTNSGAGENTTNFQYLEISFPSYKKDLLPRHWTTFTSQGSFAQWLEHFKL
jgi:hypothetical protein